ncbi:MAG: PAS domain-containing protein [Polyangiaceae bacterium]
MFDASRLRRRKSSSSSPRTRADPSRTLPQNLDYSNLADDAREVLRTLVYKEKPVTTRDGRWFTVRIMPYRTLENVIDGVVITFTDVKVNRIEESLRAQAEDLRRMVDALLEGSQEAIVVLAKDLTVAALNLAAERVFGLRRSGVGRGFFELLPRFRGTELEQKLKEMFGHREPRSQELLLSAAPNEGWHAIRIELHRDSNAVSLYVTHTTTNHP